MESQGFSKSTLELFLQCIVPAIDKDTLPECLPVCKTWQELVKGDSSQPKSAILCMPECSQSLANFAQIPRDIAREDFPPFLRRPCKSLMLPEYHYTLVRQRQQDGSLRLHPVVRRMDWTMDELIELYLVATQFEASHVQAMVRWRWELMMDGLISPKGVELDSINRLFAHPEVSSSVKKLLAQWLHDSGLTAAILNSEEQVDKTLSSMLCNLRNGRILCTRLRSQNANFSMISESKDTDVKAIAIRLLHAARRDYPDACDRLMSQLGVPVNRASIASSLLDSKGSDELAHEFQNQQRLLEAGRAGNLLIQQGWEALSKGTPEEESRIGQNEVNRHDDLDDDEDWDSEMDLW